MAVKPSKTATKKAPKALKEEQYDAKFYRTLQEYSQALIVGADNVGPNQLQCIRRAVRGHSGVLMGKNTVMKRRIIESFFINRRKVLISTRYLMGCNVNWCFDE
ncbi:hypothetical protein OIU78_008022 [Salix suchowensis]|nr:hypothetical protein OIU78_008022 [Salix suchowensis]